MAHRRPDETAAELDAGDPADRPRERPPGGAERHLPAGGDDEQAALNVAAAGVDNTDVDPARGECRQSEREPEVDDLRPGRVVTVEGEPAAGCVNQFEADDGALTVDTGDDGVVGVVAGRYGEEKPGDVVGPCD